MYTNHYTGYKANNLKFECDIIHYEPDDYINMDLKAQKKLKDVNKENDKRENKIIDMLSKKPFIRFECDVVFMEE